MDRGGVITSTITTTTKHPPMEIYSLSLLNVLVLYSRPLHTQPIKRTWIYPKRLGGVGWCWISSQNMVATEVYLYIYIYRLTPTNRTTKTSLKTHVSSSFSFHPPPPLPLPPMMPVHRCLSPFPCFSYFLSHPPFYIYIYSYLPLLSSTLWYISPPS